MDVVNFFKFIGKKYPRRSWERVISNRKEAGEEIPLEDEGGNYSNGKKNGGFAVYERDYNYDKGPQYVAKKLTYKNGTLDGPYSEYFVTETPYVIGNYKDGNWDGALTYYYPNSTPKSIYNYKDGIKNGKQITYHQNGGVESEMNFVGGRKEGEALTYHPNGNLQNMITYVKGHPDGPYKTYYENGDLHSMGEYNGEQMGMTQKGESFVYYPGNQLMSYINRNTGESREYRSDGTIKNETKVDGNKRTIIIYHENGNVASHQTMTHDENGDLKSDNNWVMYDEDGNKTFENDKFIN